MMNKIENLVQKSESLKENKWEKNVFNSIFPAIAHLRVHARWTGSSISAREPQPVP